MKGKLIGVASVLLSVAASAAPVYLECELNEADNKTTHYRFTLNEEAQNAILTDDTLTSGRSYTVPAQFTADSVLFKWYPLGNISSYALQFEVSRTTLELARVPNRPNVVVLKGPCKIAQPPADRKF